MVKSNGPVFCMLIEMYIIRGSDGGNMPENEKLDAALDASLQLSGEEQDSVLRFGYEQESKMWRVIVKYVGDIRYLENMYPGTRVVELFGQYAILTVEEKYLPAIAAMPEIIYVEKPKRIYFVTEEGRRVSCINSVQKPRQIPGVIQPEGRWDLSGKGTLVGIIDSGIDYFHPAFRNEDGTTRIAWLWDQSSSTPQSEGRVPAGYGYGAQYSSEDINEALAAGDREKSLAIVPVTDRGSGHGTAVAGVAAGNGRGSAGERYRGVAPESELVVVKLGRQDEDFAGTTEVMEGIDYVLRKALEMQRPVAVNLSFGNNNGAHDGESLFESYITDLNGVWKNVIVIASGNEGDSRHHAVCRLSQGGQVQTVSFAVGQRERGLSLQLWKQYVDQFDVELLSPSGRAVQVIREEGSAVRYRIGENEILVYYGSPTPFTIAQEIFIEWLPVPGRNVESGIWSLRLTPVDIREGNINLWLPTAEEIGLSTGFLEPSPDTTLTIPSTARKVITVGAYRSENDSPAGFSGRGNTADGRKMPTIAAPGVGIITASPGGGYTAHTGTSIAAPFVTGSAALMLEWGVVRGNDPYLYGEKVKAYLMRGARGLPGFVEYPNTQVGWGVLCLRDSLPG